MDPARRIAVLEAKLAPAQRSAKRWRTLGVAALVVTLALAALAAGAVSSAVKEWKGVYGEVKKYDASTFQFNQASTGLAGSTMAAVGTAQVSAVELDLILATASTAVAEGNWYYQVNVREVSAALLGGGTYKATLMVNGVDKGALYFVQGVSLPLSIEGVTLRWDLGPSLSSTYSTLLTIQAV